MIVFDLFFIAKSSSCTVEDFEIGNLLGRGRLDYVYCGREEQTPFVVAHKVIEIIINFFLFALFQS